MAQNPQNPQHHPEATVTTTKETNAKLVGFLVLAVIVLVLAGATYLMAGAFISGVVGLGGLATLFRGATGV